MYERVANLVTIPKKSETTLPREPAASARSEPLPPISRAPRGGAGRVKATSYDIAPACGDAQIRSMPIYGNPP